MKITEKIPENNLIDSPEKVESTILYFPKCIAVVMKKKNQNRICGFSTISSSSTHPPAKLLPCS